jgi:hypothetical protein
MKNNRHAKPKLTPFERETERRRREMHNHLAGRVGRIPTSSIKIQAAHGAKKSWLRLLLPDRKPEARA